MVPLSPAGAPAKARVVFREFKKPPTLPLANCARVVVFCRRAMAAVQVVPLMTCCPVNWPPSIIWLRSGDSRPARTALNASNNSRLRIKPSIAFRSMSSQRFVPFEPMYRISTVVFLATSRWISKFQFWVYGETWEYVVIPSERSVVGGGKGDVLGVPVASVIGSVTPDSDV